MTKTGGIIWTTRLGSLLTIDTEGSFMEQTQSPVIVETHVLSASSYDILVKRLPQLGLVSDPITAGTMIGIQLVLQELRRGFVASR